MVKRLLLGVAVLSLGIVVGWWAKPDPLPTYSDITSTVSYLDDGSMCLDTPGPDAAEPAPRTEAARVSSDSICAPLVRVDPPPEGDRVTARLVVAMNGSEKLPVGWVLVRDPDE
jgi:hypothetical protein